MIKKILITLIILMALTINFSATSIELDDEEDLVLTSGSLRGASRVLAQDYVERKVAQVQTVARRNVSMLRLINKTVGFAGKKCKHQEICCKGKCVNLMTDKRNCGGCNNRCKRGNSCMLVMCSYA
ncbi:putative stigma-specific protein Stig1 [Helianthus annuus]|nr:putative stigma-specific protein Stig1 [Helianthus annuus]KAJ0472056.1 putative stigma-specific protein Stig1 [Helianthus annuus]KAJ0651526.1 putative stigma-specific protein Stig1 [Helianthus annuus]